MTFPHLHCHTEYSLLDGYGKLSSHLKKADDIGMGFFCLTDHGTLRGAYELLKKCDKLQPIIGMEAYYVTKCEKHDEHKKHIILIAQNMVGLKNLIKINNYSWIDGFFRKPRVDFDVLKQYKEGIIISSACINGIIADPLKKNLDLAIKRTIKFKEEFGDNFYLEMQLNEIPEQIDINKNILDLSESLKISVLITGDSHYPNKEDKEIHDLIRCIGMRKTYDQVDEVSYTGNTYYLFTLEEAEEMRKNNHNYISKQVFSKAINNAWDIASNISYDTDIFDKFAALIPEFNGKDLIASVIEGWEQRSMDIKIKEQSKKRNINFNELKSIYIDRLTYELNIIESKKFENYFLLVKRIYDYAKANDIFYGIGRGSSSSSFVSYLLGITGLDPIEWDLIFERFISPDRIDLPDIDMDFESVERKSIYKFLRDTYGEDNVIKVGTLNKMKAKSCLKDVARVYNIDFADINEYTKMIIDRSANDPRADNCLEDTYSENEKFKEFCDKNYNIFLKSCKFEGQIRQTGMHPAGVIVVPEDKKDFLIIEKHKNEILTAYDMNGVQDFGYVKFDILGLNELTIIKETLKLIKQRHEINIDIYNLDLNDQKVIDNYNKHQFVGIFQFDTHSAQQYAEQINFDCFNDINSFVALNRPGTMRSGISKEFSIRKKDNSKIIKVHPIYDKITQDTLGLILFQEQMIKLFIELANYTPGEADQLRKKIGKKAGEEVMLKEKDKFMSGVIDKGLDSYIVEDLFNSVLKFGEYAFNKPHSVAYAILSYCTMYLKYYYPLEFYVSNLNFEDKDSDKMKNIRQEMELNNIKLIKPNLNISDNDFIIMGNNIISSLNCIKNTTVAGIREIVKKRPFKDLNDFINRTSKKSMNIRVIRNLAKAGVFTGNIIPSLKWYIEIGEEEIEKARKSKELMDVPKEYDEYSDVTLEYYNNEVSPFINNEAILLDIKKQFNSMGYKIEVRSDFGCCAGLIEDVRINKGGDFEQGNINEEKSKAIRFGEKFAYINVRLYNNKIYKFKISMDSYTIFEYLLNKGQAIAIYYKRSKWNEKYYYEIICMIDLNKKELDNRKNFWYEEYFLNLDDKLSDIDGLIKKMKQNNSSGFRGDFRIIYKCYGYNKESYVRWNKIIIRGVDWRKPIEYFIDDNIYEKLELGKVYKIELIKYYSNIKINKIFFENNA